MSKLNKQLLEAIEKWDEQFHSRAEISSYDFPELVSECEKICLQAQIDLLKTVIDNSNLYSMGANVSNCYHNLQEQLKQLNQ